MATIYIAGSYARREELLGRARDLVMAGHRVTSRWLKGNDQLSKTEQIDMDLEDLQRADVVMSFTGGPDELAYHSGGRHAELGYAMAGNDYYGDIYRLMLVGQPENIFHHRHDVEAFATFEEALSALPSVTAGTVMAAARVKAAAL